MRFNFDFRLFSQQGRISVLSLIIVLREVYLRDTVLIEVVIHIENGFINLRLLVAHLFERTSAELQDRGLTGTNGSHPNYVGLITYA